jgi:hypothetical protein
VTPANIAAKNDTNFVTLRVDAEITSPSAASDEPIDVSQLLMAVHHPLVKVQLPLFVYPTLCS